MSAVTELPDPEPEGIYPFVCDICGEPIYVADNPEAVHYYHEPTCPNYYMFGENFVECDCDGMAHEECCPECKDYDDEAIADLPEATAIDPPEVAI